MIKYSLLVLFAFVTAIASYGQTTLPFFEGFEKIGSTTTFTSATTSINGLSDWEYEKTNRGRIRFKPGSNFYHSGSAAVTFDASSNNQYSTNYLILTLDLSNYDESHLELSFAYMDHGDESNNEDRIWVRGEDTKSWVQIYDWYGNRTTTGNWKEVKGLDIDATLARAGQTVGKTFQLRIGQRDNWPTTNTTNFDGMTIDDIEIVERFERDAYPTEFSNFCSGSGTLKTTLYNEGLDTIKTAVVDWWVNSVQQKSLIFSGQILPGAFKEVTLGTTTFTSSNTILAVVDSINGDTDQVRNDTLKVVKGTGLSGKYTIGGTGADFTTPTTAIAALTEVGLCGSVEFTVNNGSFSGALTLPEIKGSSATNTITFDGRDSSKAAIGYNGSAKYATLDIQGADWVTFKNLKIRTSATSRGWCVHLNSAASNISFENCWFEMSTSATTDVIGVVASSSGTNEFGYGDNVNKLSIKNSRFVGGEKGAHIMGNNTSGPSTNLEISDCIFDRIATTGIYITDRTTVNLEGNTLSGFRTAGSNAMVIYDVNDFNIEDNSISGRNYAFYFQNANLNSNKRSRVVNNMLTTSGYGMRFDNVRSTDIFHNTVIGEPAFRVEDNTNLSVKNNLFYSLANYAFRGDSENGFDALDWNVYYSGAANKYAIGTSNFSSLTNWQGTHAFLNENSVQTNPPLVSAADPHLSSTKSSPRAPVISGISDDFEGDFRCIYAASIGADESTYSDPKPTAKFNLPSPAFFQAQVLLKDLSTGGDVLGLEWFVNGTLVNTGTSELNYNFSKYGLNKVMLRTTGCGGSDTLTKFIQIDSLKLKPESGFTVNKTVVSVGDIIAITNTSKNGPSKVFWSVSPQWTSNNKRTYQFVAGTDSVSYNAQMAFVEPGEYTICLYTINALGNDTRCKYKLITVKDEAQICGNEDESNIGYGTLRDPGGTDNYRGNQRYSCSYLVAPCAKSINLRFTEFDLIDNRDYLKIYEGSDNTGKALHNYHSSYSSGLTGDMASGNFDRTLQAASGSVYLEFTTSSFFGAPGFELEWSSTSISVAPPTVDFNLPDTVCAGTELFFDNQSSGFGNKYLWSISSPSTNAVEYEDSTTSHYFFFSGKYEVTLVANNCGGSDTMTKKIIVVDAKSSPTAKLKVNFTKPDVGQAVTFDDVSTVSGYVCSEYRQWSFSPATYSFASGYNAQGQRTKVIFRRPGCYDATLIVGNSVGYDTLRMKCVVNVLNRCVPKVGALEGDIGIARVQLADIDNSSASGQAAYTDYRETDWTILQKGQTYDIKITRQAAPRSNMKRAVWIDYNQDGDFNDIYESVAKSSTSNRGLAETFSFRVPKSTQVSTSGITTMRIGVSKNNGSNTACGTNPIGEFEDYRVHIVQDFESPIITLIGAKDTTLQQCVSWTDPLAYATDNADQGWLPIIDSGKVDSSAIGKYLVAYSYTDSAGNVGVARRTVTVLGDTLAPEITITGSDTVYVDVFDTYTDAGFTSFDHCNVAKDSTIGKVNTNILGTYTLTFRSWDGVGNVSSETRTVIVEDHVPPVMDSLLSGDTVYVAVFNNYVEPGQVYHDNYDEKADITVDISGYLDKDVIGTYILSYTLTDLSNNQDSFFRWVIIYDDIKPVVTLLGNAIDTIEVFDTYKDSGVRFSDNYNDSASLTYTIKGSYGEVFGLDQIADSVGTFTIAHEVIDESGNTTIGLRTIVVVDTEKPSMTLLGLNPMYITRWDSFIEPGWNLQDNYWKPADIQVTVTGTVNANSAGIYVLTYFPTDLSGNVGASVTRTVVVEESANSLRENGYQGFSIYPNPAQNDFFVVSHSDAMAIAQVRVVDLYGHEVLTSSTQGAETRTMSLSINGMASGVYSVVVTFSDGSMTVKKLTKVD